MKTNAETLYGMEGWEELFDSIEEVVDRYVDNADGTVGDDASFIEAAIWPAEVLEYRRMKKPNPEALIEQVLEWLDEMFGDPGGDSTDPTPKMLEAMKVILDEYQVWACVETGGKVVVTKDEATEMLK
jgi:hypothetical protein